MENIIKRVPAQARKAMVKVQAKRDTVKTVLKEKSGQLLVDHAGWVAAIVLIIGLVIAFTLPVLKSTVLPAIQQKVMGLFTYSG